MLSTAAHTPPKSVTSHDVAELAGVSQSAVSRSFTPGASVAEATRTKVMQAAKRLGYLPNLHARTLITGRTRIVGVVLAHLDNLFYPRFLQLLSEQLQTQGMQVMLFIAEGQGNDNLLEHMLQYRVDAIVLAPADSKASPAAPFACPRESVKQRTNSHDRALTNCCQTVTHTKNPALHRTTTLYTAVRIW